ncbi:MAG: GntR family transcriptional regulator [Myxococcota bacterium]
MKATAPTERGGNAPSNDRSAERIFEILRRRILADEVRAGESLDGERVLAPALDTNRNTLREAIRKLEQDRLVHVRHGKSVLVNDFRRSGRSELIGPFLEQGADVAERVGALEDILRLRLHVVDALLELAVERATELDVERLASLCAQQIEAFGRGDRTALARGDAAWIEALVDAARSLPMRWMANGLLEVFDHMATRLPAIWLVEPTYPAFLGELLDAVRAHDSAAARATARAYFERNDRRIRPLLPAAIKALGAAPGEAPTPHSKGGKHDARS